MELTKEQRYKIYRFLAEDFQQARLAKGWSLEEASIQTEVPLSYLTKIEYDLNSLHKQPLGKLIGLASNYDKVMKIEFTTLE